MYKPKTTKNLTSKDELTTFIKKRGIDSWDQLIDVVKNIPYGRNSNRTDFELVIREQKGSCSSKHAFLKKVADLNGIPNVELILGIYKMNKSNTPNIGDVLINNAIDFIPEAHCYLRIEGTRNDVTTVQSDFSNLKKDIIQEIEIQPEQVVEFKVDYHKKYLKSWIVENEMKMNFDDLWKIREACIENLTE